MLGVLLRCRLYLSLFRFLLPSCWRLKQSMDSTTALYPSPAFVFVVWEQLGVSFVVRDGAFSCQGSTQRLVLDQHLFVYIYPRA